jgi:hypothetical protein
MTDELRVLRVDEDGTTTAVDVDDACKLVIDASDSAYVLKFLRGEIFLGAICFVPGATGALRGFVSGRDIACNAEGATLRVDGTNLHVSVKPRATFSPGDIPIPILLGTVLLAGTASDTASKLVAAAKAWIAALSEKKEEKETVKQRR